MIEIKKERLTLKNLVIDQRKTDKAGSIFKRTIQYHFLGYCKKYKKALIHWYCCWRGKGFEP